MKIIQIRVNKMQADDQVLKIWFNFKLQEKAVYDHPHLY